MIDAANISARVVHLRRSYVDRLQDEADRIRDAMEAELNPVILDMFEQQLRKIEENIERMGDDEVATEDKLLDFAFWTLETYAILSAFLRRWVVIGWRFGQDVTGVPLPDLSENDTRVASFIEQMRKQNDHITDNTRSEIQRYLASVEALYGKELKARTVEVLVHFRQYFERRGTTISELNANAAFLRGYLSAMIAAGVQQKMWVSQRDKRVRKSHVIADGQIVPIRGFFLLGDEGWPLLHPADPNAPMKERLGCRCFMVPVAGAPFPEGPQPAAGL